MNRPTRWSLWLLGLAAVAIGLALVGRDSAGYVVFMLPPKRIELSFVLFVVLLFVLFGVAYVLTRIAIRSWEMPQTLQRWRADSARTQARDAVFLSLQQLFSGQFRDAENTARSAMEHADTQDLAAALAAWAAYEGGNSGAAVPYLDRISGERSAHMRDASKAYMLLADGRTPEALALLKSLSQADPRNPGVLKMKVEAEMAEKAWDDVLATLAPLSRSGLLPEAAAAQIRLSAEMNLIKSKPANADAVISTWQSFGTASKSDVALAGCVAQKLVGMGARELAAGVVEESIKLRGPTQWASELVAVYADCGESNVLTQIENAETWLKAQPRDPILLATLGKLCMRQSLWGKAQSYLEASAAMLPSQEVHMTLARLMEQLGKREDAIRHIRRSAELIR